MQDLDRLSINQLTTRDWWSLHEAVDAQAYEIERINQAVGDNPNYVRLQALEALRAISKDPASKIYFMDGSSPMPLPLMHMGETGALTR